MKTKIWIGILASLFVMGMFACEPDRSGLSPYFSDWDPPAILQGYVLDGITGDPLSGASITVDVGSAMMSASTDATGYYSIYGLPNQAVNVGITLANYFSFKAYYTPANGGVTIKNVRMYPINYANEDYIMRLYDNDGTVVTTATVTATITTPNGAGILDTEFSDYAYSNTNGAVVNAQLSATPDATTGDITFAQAQLILGATYTINIYNASDAAGYPYEYNGSALSFTVGVDHASLPPIFLDKVAATPVALSVNTADADGNVDYTTEQSSFVVTFATDIEVCSDEDNHSWTNVTILHPDYARTDSDLDGNWAQAAGTDALTVAASGNTLTVSDYEAATGTEDADDNLIINLTGIMVQVMGTDTCVSLGAVQFGGPPYATITPYWPIVLDKPEP